MPTFKNKIIYLLRVYSNGEATYAEEQMLFKYLNNTDDKRIICKHILKIMGEYKLPENMAPVNWEIIFQKIKNKIK